MAAASKGRRFSAAAWKRPPGITAKHLVLSAERELAWLRSWSAPRPMAAKSCFRTCSDIGRLVFTDWRGLGLPTVAFRDFESPVESLRAGLKALLLADERHQTSLRRGWIRERTQLEGGVQSVRAALHAYGDAVVHDLQAREVEAMLLGPRDRIGFALLLAQDFGLSTSRAMGARMARVDESLRPVLGDAERIYAAQGDPLEPENAAKGRFPNSFWWRHLEARALDDTRC